MFVGNTVINRPFENIGNSWNNNIRVDLKGCVNGIGSGSWRNSLLAIGLSFKNVNQYILEGNIYCF
jgi:hypothetical protein